LLGILAAFVPGPLRSPVNHYWFRLNGTMISVLTSIGSPFR
jgi:hypothetical protein